MLALRSASVAAAVTAALAYSPYGYPGHRYGFEPFHHFGGYGSHGAWPYQEEAYRPPCPKYRPMEMGAWEQVMTPQGGAYQLSVMLPGVHRQHRRVELTGDGRGVQISGYRQVPTRGRARALECLPEDARLSRDGRYEILEAEVFLPQAADASRASVRHGRQGLEITAPFRPELRPRQPPAAARPNAQQEGRAGLRQQPAPADVHRTSDAFHDGARGGRDAVATRDRRSPGEPKPPVRQPVVAPEAQQPRTDGIEIIEEEYLYPEKDADAAEGWYDNRNEFQLY